MPGLPAVIPPLIVRADAGPRIGVGHLVRSLSLAQAWQDGGGRVILLTTSPAGIPAGTSVDGMDVVSLQAAHPNAADAATLERLVAKHPGAWVVCDGYHLDAEYTRRAKRAGARVLVIDDVAHAPLYCADVLLNQNLGAERFEYRCDGEPSRLFGPRFALLRRAFRAWRGWTRPVLDRAACVLVSVGGGDANDVALTIVRACRRIAVSPLRVAVLVGPFSEVGGALSSAADLIDGVRFEMMSNPSDVPRLMAEADVAISASGSTVWELCFMGVPSVLVTVADNQAGIADRLEAIGCATSLGWHTDVDEARTASVIERLLLDRAVRASMSAHGRALVDGGGAERVAAILREMRAA